MATLAMPFDASVDMAAQQAYARLVASLGGSENAEMVSARARQMVERASAARARCERERDRCAAVCIFFVPLTFLSLRSTPHKTQQGKQQQKQQRSMRPALSELSANTAATAVRERAFEMERGAPPARRCSLSLARLRPFFSHSHTPAPRPPPTPPQPCTQEHMLGGDRAASRAFSTSTAGTFC